MTYPLPLNGIRRKRKIFLIGITFLIILSVALLVYDRFRSAHDLVRCQHRAFLFMLPLSLYQADHPNQIPDSIDTLKTEGYLTWNVTYFDSKQGRSLPYFYYNDKDSPLVLSSEILRQGWTAAPVRVLAISGLGVVTVSEREFQSILSRRRVHMESR